MESHKEQVPDPTEIHAALERVLRSEQFALSSRLSRFLRYVVTESLEGRGSALKEYSIGVSVYDRGTDFDPKSDSIVRVDAVKLRSRLSEYYAGKGAAEELRISIPKGGYVASFELIAPTCALAKEPATNVVEAPAGGVKANRIPRLGLGLAILAGLGLLGAGVMWRNAPRHEEVVLKPLTTYPGDEYRPSVSPDGRYVAFGWSRSDGTDLWLRPIEEDKPVRLTNHPKWEGAPEWSPSGEWIAFSRESVGTVVLNPVSREERVLGEAPAHPCLGWMPDSQRVLLGGLNGSLRAINIKGSEGIEIAEAPKAGSRILCGKASPDGNWLAVMTETDLFLRPLAGGDWVGLTEDHMKLRSFTWMPDSGSILYTGARQGDWTLWRVSREGGDPTRVPGPGQGVWYVSAGRDAVVYQQDSHDSNLVVVDLEEMQTRRVYVSTKQEQDMRVSRDGRQVAFVSDRDGNRDLWVGETDGSGLRRLTDLQGEWVEGPAWSSDGKEIAFYSVRDGNSDIYTVPSEGGAVRRVTESVSSESRPEWSRDGKWIYFVSDRSGRNEIWRQELSSGKVEQLSFEGGHHPRLDPKGEWLYYIGRRNPNKLPYDGRGPLLRMPASGGKTEDILSEIGAFHWSVSGTGVIYLDPEGSRKSGKPVLQMLPFSGGSSTRIGMLPLSNMVLSLDAPMSGKSLMVALLESVSEDLVLLRGLR